MILAKSCMPIGYCFIFLLMFGKYNNQIIANKYLAYFADSRERKPFLTSLLGKSSLYSFNSRS